MKPGHIDTLISYSNKNLNTLKHIIMYTNKMLPTDNYKLTNILSDMANTIINDLENQIKYQSSNVIEKYHYSELNILDLAKQMDKLDLFVQELKTIHLYLIHLYTIRVYYFLKLHKFIIKICKHSIYIQIS